MAKSLSRRVHRARGPSYGGSKKPNTPAFDLGPSSLQEVPAGDRAMTGAPDISKELTWLHETSYDVNGENSLGRHS